MTHLVSWYRAAFTLHAMPELSSVIYVTAFSLVAAVLGRVLFLRARPHFADLI
jgi:ABC-type polysaccharide/polyol phosphate export permease